MEIVLSTAINEFLKNLFSENNIAGFWAVLGALIASMTTMLGIFLNNAFESRRKRKEREHSLIRESYFGGVEYINYYVSRIALIAQTEKIDVDGEVARSSEKFYRLIVIGSVDVIDKFSSLSVRFSEALMVLSHKVLLSQKFAIDIKLYEDAYARALQQMESINNDRREYNNRAQSNPELWDLFEKHYQIAQNEFDENISKAEVGRINQLALRMEIIKDCINALAEISPDIYDVMFLMRSDLDRKLNKKEERRLKKILDTMLEQTKASMEFHIKKLEDSIVELSHDED